MGKTNVKYTNKAFGVNTKKNEVNCTLTCEINLDKVPMIEFLSTKPEFHKYLTNLILGYNMKLYDNTIEGNNSEYGVLSFSTTGKSKCSPEDEFDEVKGKRLSLTRAQANAFIVARNIYYDLFRMLSMDMIKLYGFYQNSYESHSKCIEHIEKTF